MQIKVNKKYKLIVLVFATTIACIGYFTYSHFFKSGEIATLSVSSDGRYAISGDAKHFIILWDLDKHSKKIISRHGNMYSTYWVKDTPYYMWQDLNKNVYIQDVDGKTIKEIQAPFRAYGNVITSDLTQYIASDINWNIFTIENNKVEKLATWYDDADFLGANKLINFNLLNDGGLLTTGMPSISAQDPKDNSGIISWNLSTKKQEKDFLGNNGAAFSTLSPDGKYMVSGDIGGLGFVWNVSTGEKISDLMQILHGDCKPIPNSYKYNCNNKGLIPVPNDFVRNDDGEFDIAFISIKFIDNKHYLRFTKDIPYAILYHINDRKPLKYLSLGRHPEPSLEYFERNQAIDTSPTAHVLVMGKENWGGILVYRYDPTTQTLKKIWDAS